LFDSSKPGGIAGPGGKGLKTRTLSCGHHGKAGGFKEMMREKVMK
jgi:hypothetical protein